MMLTDETNKKSAYSFLKQTAIAIATRAKLLQALEKASGGILKILICINDPATARTKPKADKMTKPFMILDMLYLLV